ncbi:MAG: LPS-assembly protein LptD [Deltaproteobacteria bacterium]|nr:MAG: LPS-assembly protein LptD [Deltaproteobacteria bacterium]
MAFRRYIPRAAPLILALVLGQPALAGGPELEAERIRVEQDGWTASNVTLRLAEGEVTAQRATRRGDGPIELEHGEWIGAEARASFVRATLDLQAQTLRLDEARLRPCACDGPEPWGVRAAAIEIDERVARPRGAKLEVLGRPILPLPALPVPLARRSGLLPPELLTSQDGLIVRAPAYLTLGEAADLTLTPELRTLRGPRLSTEARYALIGGGGEVRLEGAHDRLRQKARGAVRWEHRAEHAPVRTATSLAMISDPLYWRDYEDRRLDRLLPFTTSRALVGGRHWEAHAFGAAASPREAFGLVQAAGLLPWTRLRGGFLIGGSSTLSALGRTRAGAPSLNLAGTGRLAVERPTWLGPLRWTPSMETGLWAAPSTAQPLGLYGGAGSELALPLWSSLESGFVHIEPLVGAHARLGRPGLQYALSTILPTSVSAGLRARRTFGGDGVVEAMGQALWTDEGLNPHTELRIQRGPVVVQGVWRPGGPDPLAWVDLGIDPGPVAMHARAIHQPDPERPLQLAGGDLIARPGPFEIAIGTDVNLGPHAWLSRRAWAAWTHPSGCLRLGLTAFLDEDRDAPDLGLLIDVFPRR